VLPAHAQQQPQPSLSSFYTEGYVFQDRNGDDVIDFVNARLIIPETPSHAEVVAASNIAARFGFETAAVNLDLIAYGSSQGEVGDRPVVQVGESAITTAGDGSDRARLSPGQGLIEWTPPTDQYPRGGVHVAGEDATGLIAAANHFAGRFPILWGGDGSSLTDAEEQVQQFVNEEEIGVSELRVAYLVVDQNRPGVSILGLHIQADDASEAARLVEQLNEEEPPDAFLLEDVHSVVVHVESPEGASSVRVEPEEPWATARAEDKAVSHSEDFSLYELYTIDGLLKDTNGDFVPDDNGGYISYAGSEGGEGLVDFTTRLGLETAGMRFPVVRPASRQDRPEHWGFPILVGRDHPSVKQLRRDGKLLEAEAEPDAEAEPGEGYVQFVKEAFDESPALVVGGSDAEGLQSALDYLAGRMPYLWEYGKGEYRLERIETDVRRFFQGVEGPGQVAAGLEKLDTWLERLQDQDVESIEVELAAEEAPAPLEEFVQQVVQSHYPSASTSVQVTPTGFGVGKSIFEDRFDIPWEVDAFWEAFRRDVLPQVSSSAEGRIELRVSESPEVRAQLEEDIQAELAEKGVEEEAVDVTVLSAYKQGFSWLADEVLPQLRGVEALGRIEVSYHSLKESDEVRWQTINADTRWLQELYPVDGILAKELAIADSLITFHPTWSDAPIYRVRAFDDSGEEVYSDDFDPKYVVRPYFDHFPEHDSVRVTTGWLYAELDGRTVADQRIKTDLETFWDHFQDQTIGQIIAYVMDIQDGDPDPDLAPFFDELDVNVQLSEPNYRLGIQEHTISATEALHEDIYFHMLTLFDLIGNRYNVSSLDYPGRILPHIQPPVDGEPGKAHIRFTGKDRARPELRLTYTARGEEPVLKQYELPNIDNVPAPILRGIWTRSGSEAVTRLLFDVEAEVEDDAYEAFRQRAPEDDIDRAYPSVERLEGMLDMLQQLKEQGVFEEVLSYDRVEELGIRFVLADSTAFSQLAVLPRSSTPGSTDLPELQADGFQHDGSRIVQWDTPIPPAEANDIIAKLGTFPVVRPYYMATSFLGHDVFAIDILPPHEARYLSQPKLNAQKPTLYLNAREDGNEVSSTSYTLRLAEHIATDPDYAKYLDRVNLVIHPMNNPDGAQVAYEMQEVNPDFMLHAGYYAALGPSLGAQSDEDDPLYPEAKVKPRLWETWLPDIFMNLHGYPSHEWVQYFAGYSAWVFSRNGTSRSWWPTRGYFLTGFNWVDDPDYPDLKTVAFAALDSITTSIGALDELTAKSREEYRRYRKYLSQEGDYGEYFRNGIRVNAGIKGRDIDSERPSSYRDPRITNFAITTEAQDETARGDWLKLQAGAGLAATTGALRYLYHGVNTVEREVTEDGEYIVRKIYRKKPVLPKAENDEAEGED
jgi:hypothetical protein